MLFYPVELFILEFSIHVHYIIDLYMNLMEERERGGEFKSNSHDLKLTPPNTNFEIFKVAGVG